MRWTSVLAVVPALFCMVAACGKNAAPVSRLEGHVTDILGAPLAQATVLVNSSKRSAVTDANGYYSMTTGIELNTTTAIQVSHPTHATVVVPARLQDETVQEDFLLTPYGLTTEIKLPGTGEPDVVLSTAKADSTLTLGIGANSLALADGTVASGNVTVAMAYWHPLQNLRGAPAPLRGGDANANPLIRLLTAGMADVTITQGDQTLQVAAGKTLDLNFVVPPESASILQDSNVAGIFALWSADPVTGVWKHESELDGKTLAYNADSNTFAAKLKHLSSWNIDGYMGPNGCVTGKVVDSCGKTVSARDVTLWLLTDNSRTTFYKPTPPIGQGAIAQYRVTTDSSGGFCTNFIGSSDNDPNWFGSGKQERYADAFYFISAAGNPGGATCNPTGKSSFAQLCNAGSGAGAGGPHLCTGLDPSEMTNPWGGRYINYTGGVQGCKTPSKGLQLCGHCPGQKYNQCVFAMNGYQQFDRVPVQGKCTDLGTLVLPGCGGTVGDPPTTGVPPVVTPPKPIDRCEGKPSTYGLSCNTNEDCCPSLYQCLDGHCLKP